MNSHKNIMVEVPVNLVAEAMDVSGPDWSLKSLQSTVTTALNNYTNTKPKKKSNDQH